MCGRETNNLHADVCEQNENFGKYVVKKEPIWMVIISSFHPLFAVSQLQQPTRW